MRIRINPYKAASASAAALAQYLDAKHPSKVLRLKRDSQFHPRPEDVIINYGIGHANIQGGVQLNQPDAVRQATNKLHFFQAMQRAGDVRIPDFTRDIDIARGWTQQGHKVCCRTNLTGHSADGLVLAETAERVVRAPLYTKYMPKTDEYRVHVVRGVVVDVQRKARQVAVPDQDVNWQVRNHDNGFIYMRDGVNIDTVPEDVIVGSTRCMQALGIDFGSVDVIWHRRYGTYVLEVNTASGLEGTTLERIGDALYALTQNEQPVPWADLPGMAPQPRAEAPVAPEPEPEPAIPNMPDRVRQELENDLIQAQEQQRVLEDYREALRAKRRGEQLRRNLRMKYNVAGQDIQLLIRTIRDRLENPAPVVDAEQQVRNDELRVML